MLTIADDLSCFTLAAGEPFLLDLRLRDADGTTVMPGSRAFVLAFHDDDRITMAAIDGIALPDGETIRFARDGGFSESLYGMPLTVELAERHRDGREVIASGRLAVLASAGDVVSLTAGEIGRWATRVTLTFDATGIRDIVQDQVPYTGASPIDPSAPVLLAPLSLSGDALTAGVAVSIAIAGATAGSAITGTPPAGLTLDGAARTIAGTPQVAGNHPVILTETLAGAANSPRTTDLTLAVAARPVVTLSAAIAQAEGTGTPRAYLYTVTRSVAAGAVAVAWTFSPGQTAPEDFAGGAYPAGGSVALADGVASGTFTILVAGDAVFEPDESFTVAIVPPPGYAGGARIAATGTILNDDAAPLIGFAANGAANTAFRAAVARVRAGTGRGRIVWKGDSITVGQGAGSTADAFGLTGARAKRIPATLAALLTAGGTPTLDASFVADQAVDSATGQSLLTAFDPRITLSGGGSPGWTIQPASALAGGGYWQPGLNGLDFTPDGPVDRFEIVAYRSAEESYTLAIDGAVPAIGAAQFATAAGSGFVRHVVGAAAPGTHRLSIVGTTRAGALRSVTAWRSDAAGLDIVVHAALGALSAHQAATGSGWSNREALAFDAPDLTIVCLGLNDMNAGVAPAAYAANLRAIVDTTRQSGDALLVFPPPAGGSFNTGVEGFRDAAAAVAASAGIAFFSLYDHYGKFSPTMAARMFDGQVHPDAEYQAEIADRILSALRRMAPDLP